MRVRPELEARQLLRREATKPLATRAELGGTLDALQRLHPERDATVAVAGDDARPRDAVLAEAEPVADEGVGDPEIFAEKRDDGEGEEEYEEYE